MNPYALRRFQIADWPSFKSIRLAALQTNPNVFGNSFLFESAFPDNYWINRLSAEYTAIWGLFFGDELIGLSSVCGEIGNPVEARLATSFIKPEHEGKVWQQAFLPLE